MSIVEVKVPQLSESVAEATLLQAANAGGAVLQPAFDIPGGARVGVVADPPGAMFAVISGGPRPNGPYFSQRPGAVGWAELLTRDAAVATGFYGAVFGWTAVNDDVSGYTEFTIDGTEYLIMRESDIFAVVSKA